MEPLGQIIKSAGFVAVFILILTGCATILPDTRSTPVKIVRDQVNPAVRQPAVAKPPIQISSTYRVKPGDALFVHIFDNQELSQNVIVGPDGWINYPLVGRLKLEGLSLDRIDHLLTARLEQSLLQPEVTVKLAEVARERIFVTGEVIAPGIFEITEQISVVQAISMAGGFTAFADRTKVIVYNPALARDARRVFNYKAFLADPGAYDFALRPGDTVIVQ